MIFHLKGELGELFGSKWELDVKTVAEGIRAMFVNTKGKMETYFREHGQNYFIVKDGNYELSEETEFKAPAATNEIVIAPHIVGAGAAARIVAGLVLIAVAIWVLGPMGAKFALAANIVGGMGAALVLGGIVEMLTPVPKMEDAEQNTSYFFNNGVNTVQQNSAIPVGYGRAMIMGQPISLQLKNKDIKPGSIATNQAGASNRVVEKATCQGRLCYFTYEEV